MNMNIDNEILIINRYRIPRFKSFNFGIFSFN